MTKDPTMSEPNDSGMEFRAPPVDVPTSPVNRVIAVMDDPNEVASAIGHLVEVGYEREQIFVLCGPSGAERLDLSGRHHGLGGRLYRLAERVLAGEEREELEHYAQHLKGGGLLVSVPADEKEKSAVADVLARYGGHEMTHFGKGHWERLGA
jgi:hypothetical protein